MQAKRRIFYFDFIRAVAILTIIVFHYNVTLESLHPGGPIVLRSFFPNFDLGTLGISLFVMLSGASLMLSYSERIELRRFYFKRFLALFPSLWVAYLLFASYFFLQSGQLPKVGPWWAPILTITGFDGFLLYRIPDYYILGEWFMGMIICLYAVFPILRMAVLKSPTISMVAAVVFLGLVHHFYDHFFQMQEIRNPLIQLCFMVFGMTFIYWLPKMGVKTTIGLVMAAIVVSTVAIHWPYTFVVLLVSAIAFSLLALAGDRLSFGPRFETYVGAIAKYSYPAFLVHHVLIVLVLQRYTTVFTKVETWAMCGILVALSFAVGYMVDLITTRLMMPHRKVLATSRP